MDRIRLNTVRSVINELDKDNREYYLNRLESGDNLRDLVEDLWDAIYVHCPPRKGQMLQRKLDQVI